MSKNYMVGLDMDETGQDQTPREFKVSRRSFLKGAVALIGGKLLHIDAPKHKILAEPNAGHAYQSSNHLVSNFQERPPEYNGVIPFAAKRSEAGIAVSVVQKHATEKSPSLIPNSPEALNQKKDIEDIQKEIAQYGEFGIGNRGNLTKEYIQKLLETRKAAFSNIDELANKMIEWEEKYKVGSEYILALTYQETKFGRDIVEGKAPLAGKDNWANYGRPETIKNGHFPDWKDGLLDNIETLYWQFDKYHRKGIQTVEPVVKRYHTWKEILPTFAPLKSNPNLPDRITGGEEFIKQMRQESKALAPVK
jgi:hypothetical protein